MNYHLVTRLAIKDQRTPLSVAIAGKENKMIRAERALRAAMASASPAVQKKLLADVWPSIQAIEASVLEMCELLPNKAYRGQGAPANVRRPAA